MSCAQYLWRMSAVTGMLLYFQSIYPHTIEENNPDTIHKTHELEEFVVNGIGTKLRPRAGHILMSESEIKKTPVLLGEPDVMKALQTTSGVVAGAEGFAGLYVRGGETDQNLYLLDGLPILNVYHFGGLFSTFSPTSIECVDFYKGAFPSRFSERVSGIVDISLKKPDMYKREGSFSIGLISGQLYFSTPLRKGYSAISFSLRRTWFDLFSVPVLAIINKSKEPEGKKTIFNYNFTDISVRLDASDRKTNFISASMFFGKDNFKYGEQLFDNDNGKKIYKSDINKMSWGNWGMTLSFIHYFTFGQLKLQPYAAKSFSLDYQMNAHSDVNSTMVTATSETSPSVLQAGLKETFCRRICKGLDLEVGLQQAYYDYGGWNPETHYGDILMNPGNTSHNHSRNFLFSGFADISWDIGGLLFCSAGMRTNRYISNQRSHWNCEPRLSLKINLPHYSSLAAGYSRITQYAQQISSNYIYLPSDAWLPVASHFEPLICDIYSVAYSKNFNQDININVEAWWKNMNNLADYSNAVSWTKSTSHWPDKLAFGKGWAYGLDIDMHGNYRSINWKLAYGLMWNWRKFSEINQGRRFPAKFDNRHKLDIGIGWKISKRLELNGQWEFMTGNRMTVALYNIATPDIAFPDAPSVNPLDPDGKRQDGIDYFESRNNVRMPAFHRLNINLTLRGNLNKGLSYQWDFGLYNAYCRLNPFSLVKNYVNDSGSDKSEYRKFKSLSLLPIIPSFSFTLNF